MPPHRIPSRPLADLAARRWSTSIMDRSLIIAAHPDDEILWFSSVVERIDKVVICFLGSRLQPQRVSEREMSLLEHPLKNISCLCLDESGGYNKADWNNPVITPYGMELADRSNSCRHYRDNYAALKHHLRHTLDGSMNVFTHNPWGEYGHEEHVQVYRAIEELQKEMQFNLWFSNYCSNRSFKLMLRSISGFDSEYITLKTNKNIAHCAKVIYQKNGCWTWFDDWEWFNEESFMMQRDGSGEVKPYGHIFPLNMIKFWHSEEKQNTVQCSRASRPLRMFADRLRKKTMKPG